VDVPLHEEPDVIQVSLEAQLASTVASDEIEVEGSISSEDVP
jgi:hypothetical protein